MKGIKTQAAFLVLAAALAAAVSCASSKTVPQGIDRREAKTWRLFQKTGADEDINGVFPDTVFIKTKTQTFDSYHDYILRGGRIWYKIREPDGVIINGKHVSWPREWMLFEGTGLPHNNLDPRFTEPSYIAEISADADELVALSVEGRFYRFCFDTTIAHPSGVWLDRQGWPTLEPLLLDERTARARAWSIGKRNMQTLYYEDRFGNQHHNGAMEIVTTYMLLEDGREICYADPGLPSDFSRNFIGPERGAFRATALSASASTMFVINENGDMYTRIADFDIAGCDPMFFNYTYIPYTSELPGSSYFSNLTEWALPPPDWTAQPRIPLSGKAALSRFITILRTGQGNRARELRVAGLDKDGRRGLYTKQIDDDAWTFREAPLAIPKDGFLKPEVMHIEGGIPGAAGLLRGYCWRQESRYLDGGELWEYEIPDFNILEGSCELHIKRRGETCTLLLHPVELWTYLRRDYTPGRAAGAATGVELSVDRGVYGPKLFFMTLEIPEGAFTGLSEAFTSRLLARYQKKDKALFNYIMEATTQYVLISEGGKDGEHLFLTDKTLSNNYATLARRHFFNDYTEKRRFEDAVLRVENIPGFTRDNLIELDEKIMRNRMLLDELTGAIIRLKSYKESAFAMNISYSLVDTLARLTLLNNVDIPKIKTMTRFGRRIVYVNKAFTDIVSDVRITAYRDLVKRLKARIAEYEKVRRYLYRLNTS